MDNDLKELIAGQARIEQAVTDMNNRLFGNGQPGVIQYLVTEQKSLDSRIKTVEQRQYWLSGVGSALGFIAGLLGKKFGGI